MKSVFFSSLQNNARALLLGALVLLGSSPSLGVLGETSGSTNDIQGPVIGIDLGTTYS